eukprot:5469323-Ditylum_brightwellii.AAC.1
MDLAEVQALNDDVERHVLDSGKEDFMILDCFDFDASEEFLDSPNDEDEQVLPEGDFEKLAQQKEASEAKVISEDEGSSDDSNGQSEIHQVSCHKKESSR